MCPAKDDCVIEEIQAPTISTITNGNHHRVEWRHKTSAATLARIKKGESWWLKTQNAKTAMIQSISATRCAGYLGSLLISEVVNHLKNRASGEMRLKSRSSMCGRSVGDGVNHFN